MLSCTHDFKSDLGRLALKFSLMLVALVALFCPAAGISPAVAGGVDAMAADGLITKRSSFGPEETMKRVEAEVTAKGLTVFAHVDHAAGAATVGLPLRPTDLLIFGNPKGGTPLMQSAQSVGIDLPLKMLVWQDADGVTWLSYNDPAWLMHRHGLDDSTKAAANAITSALNAIAAKATNP
jgi:uncharacterized protein (DUF302 family)